MQTDKRQDESYILTKEANQVVKSFPTETLEKAEKEHTLMLLQDNLETTNARYLLHPLKAKLLTSIIFNFEQEHLHLEELRDALQFQMIVNTEYLLQAEDYKRKANDVQKINHVQHNLLKLVNTLIETNCRLYPTRKF